MLSRTQFTLIRLGSFVAYLGFATLVWWLVHSIAVAGLAGSVLTVVADALTWPGTGGGSYRHYLKAQGVPVPPPSRFWATTGQVFVIAVALLGVIMVTRAADRAPEGSAWRTTAIAVWIFAPTVTLLYLFGARDARRELAHRRDAP